MKTSVVTALVLLTLTTSIQAAEYQGSSFKEVWDQVKSDPYENPKNKISYGSLFRYFKNKIKESANRTLNDRSDVLPQFRKLAHPNGVCLSGTWKITEENPYGGYYKKGSEALIISRASTAMSGTKRGKLRAFGLAGKIFPTLNTTDVVKPASFFLVDDLGGTKAPNYTGVGMTNEPNVSKTVAVFSHLFYSLKLAVTFGKADSNPGIRQVYEISELGEADSKKVKTPRWMMVRAAKGQKNDAKDFRDELRVENYEGALQFEILVADKADADGIKNFKKIGNINFTDSTVSNSCDHRLHFPHPKWRSNLNH